MENSADGYELHMLSDMGILYNPKRFGGIIEVKKFQCKKDFFDIKEGMMIWGYDNPEYNTKVGLTMIIYAKKWGDKIPINQKIFDEYFEEDYGLLPFEWIWAMKSKDRNKYYKERKEQIYYE